MVSVHEAIQDKKHFFQFCCCFPISAGDYGSKMLKNWHHGIIHLFDRTVPCQGGLWVHEEAGGVCDQGVWQTAGGTCQTSGTFSSISSLYQSPRLNDQISSFVCAFLVKMWRDGDSIGCAELHFKIQLWHTAHVVAVCSDLDSCNFLLSPSSYFFLSSACVLRRSCVGAHQKGLISFCLHFLHSALLLLLFLFRLVPFSSLVILTTLIWAVRFT